MWCVFSIQLKKSSLKSLIENWKIEKLKIFSIIELAADWKSPFSIWAPPGKLKIFCKMNGLNSPEFELHGMSPIQGIMFLDSPAIKECDHEVSYHFSEVLKAFEKDVRSSSFITLISTSKIVKIILTYTLMNLHSSIGL